MLANGTGQTTDTWTYDAWGETTSRTGVTENDYQYAGERFDRTTELYQLRSRYLDPKTGTFLSLDPYQGNRHDPASLHKYMYANANPVNNVDPTGLTSIAEMSGAMAGQGILAGSSGLNFAAVLGMLVPRAEEIVVFSVLSYITIELLDAILSGHSSVDDFLDEIEIALLRNLLDRFLLSSKDPPSPPSKLKDGDKVKTPDSHPGEWSKNKKGRYRHRKTGWFAKKDPSNHGGPHWDINPPRGSGHINVGPDGNIFGGSH